MTDEWNDEYYGSQEDEEPIVSPPPSVATAYPDLLPPNKTKLMPFKFPSTCWCVHGKSLLGSCRGCHGTCRWTSGTGAGMSTRNVQ
jgi:hypothetical protein